jgi:hypothetical protein
LKEIQRRCLLTTAQIDDKWSIQVLVPHKSSVNTWTGGVVGDKVNSVLVAAKEVAVLLVDHQLLDHFALFHNV